MWLRWDNKTTKGSPECLTTSTGWKVTSKPTNFHSVGMQHKNQQHENPKPRRQGMGLKRIACNPFDAQAQSRPTQITRSPLTRRRVCRSQHNQANHPSCASETREQIEASSGVVTILPGHVTHVTQSLVELGLRHLQGIGFGL